MTLDYRVAVVDAGRGAVRERVIHALGPLEAGLAVHEEAESWASDPLSPGNPVLIGAGPFTYTPFMGSHRLLAVFRSPVSMGLHASALGGAGYALARTGFDAVLVEGRSRDPAIVVLDGGPGGFEASFHYLEPRELDRVYSGYRGYRGTRALHAYIVDLLGRGWLSSRRARILLVGPAAWTTRMAGVFSWVPGGDGMPGPVVDSASRGGGGSVLAQAHGVAAIVVGGVGDPEPRIPARRALEVAREALGKPYAKAVAEATVKYRYDPSLGTGGTFGVNYVHYRELIPALAYNTIYLSRHVRIALHEKLMRLFWRPFQEQVFLVEGPRAWRNCGEPCSVVCKKIWRGVKLDYEPAHAMGPMIGVFTLPEAARLVEEADDYGVDAIEAGHVIAWVFDMVDKGLLEPGEAGLDSKPVLDPLAVGEESSRLNAGLASSLLAALVERRHELAAMIGRLGARRAARELGEALQTRVRRLGLEPRDLLVYAAFGADGYMTPNYYWSPGMVAPLYVLGRYWTNYSPTFADPEDYARDSLARAKAELLIDNAGFCRFHRRWASKVIPAAYRELGVDLDPDSYASRIYARIASYQVRAGAEPVPWESRKTMDLVATIAAELGIQGWEDALANREKLHEWWRRFYETVMAEVQAAIARA